MTTPKIDHDCPPEAVGREFIKLRRLNRGETHHKGNHATKAIHSPRKHGPAGPRRDTVTPAVEKAGAVTLANTSDMEFEPAREEIRQLVQRSMSAAEAGVQLSSLLQRHPNLLADQPGIYPSALGGGREDKKKEGSPSTPITQSKVGALRRNFSDLP